VLDLCADLPVRRLRPGDVLIAHGAVNPPLFVLISGSVIVERDGVAFARVDHPGAMFGEMSAVLDQPATATVRAESEVAAHVVHAPRAFLLSRPELMMAVLRMTAARLDGMTRYLVDVKRQLGNGAGEDESSGEVLNVLLHHQPPPRLPSPSRDADF
jgi:CRP-like cAMP-binding protein